MAERKPVTAPELVAMKSRGEKVVVVTAYDYAGALYADRAGVDAILVGDTLGMVVQGHDTTLPVTPDEILYHVRAVVRARPRALVVADMPFLSYQVSEEEAIRTAGRFIKEGGAGAVKLEGGDAVVALVRRMVSIGIPVMAHLGLTPQSVHTLGGFRVQARSPEAARQLLRDACELEEAGAFSLVLEGVPTEVAKVVSQSLRIPTIGIGAGVHCDGQVQVFHDMLGLYDPFTPKHAKRYAELGQAVHDAIATYAAEVRAGQFPEEAHSYHQRDLEDPSKWT
ncbi:MAG: 3-methyl-2-oxobutanoate hydroxymethyltransferase [Armatimonadota bacterium]